jgi:hypothetical protein
MFPRVFCCSAARFAPLRRLSNSDEHEYTQTIALTSIAAGIAMRRNAGKSDRRCRVIKGKPMDRDNDFAIRRRSVLQGTLTAAAACHSQGNELRRGRRHPVGGALQRRDYEFTAVR